MAPKKNRYNGINNLNYFNKKKKNDDKFSILRSLLSSGVCIIEGQPFDESPRNEILKAVLELESHMSTSYQNKNSDVDAIFEQLSQYGQMKVKNADRLSTTANGNIFNLLIRI